MTHYAIPAALFIVLLLTGCGKKLSKPVTVNFDLQHQGKNITCAANSSLIDFRLYLHAIQLKDTQNQWHTVQLSPNQWQNESTLLLDFENASHGCAQGNQATNQQLRGFGIETPQAIRFTLGVPFELNHQNPLIAKAPLNESTMHWHWQSGYKFMRAEFSQDNASKRLHLGSLQCKGHVSNISHCEQPNRATYTIEHFDISQNITINLNGLLDFVGSNANADDSSDDSAHENNITCMGKAERPWCANALQWAGLKQAEKQSANHPAMFVQNSQPPQPKTKATHQ